MTLKLIFLVFLTLNIFMNDLYSIVDLEQVCEWFISKQAM